MPLQHCGNVGFNEFPLFIQRLLQGVSTEASREGRGFFPYG